jgi:hypothetical protein
MRHQRRELLPYLGDDEPDFAECFGSGPSGSFFGRQRILLHCHLKTNPMRTPAPMPTKTRAASHITGSLTQSIMPKKAAWVPIWRALSLSNKRRKRECVLGQVAGGKGGELARERGRWLLEVIE